MSAHDLPSLGYISFTSLLSSDHACRKRGTKLILCYAGMPRVEGRYVQLSYSSGKAALTGRKLILRDMREAISDREYNAVIDQVLAELRRAGNVQIPVGGGVIAELRPSTGAIQHVHDCQSAAAGIDCYFDWAAHTQSERCACGPRIDDTNKDIDGNVFVVHRGDE